MVTRVTDIIQTNNFIDQINVQRGLLNETRFQVSSGLRVGAASDDPGRAGMISELQGTVQRLGRHKERIDTSTALLEAQGTSLSTTQNILLRCKEIAIQAANDTIPSDIRASMSREVFQLREQLIGVINTRIQGSYIYGGGQDDQPPFVQGSDYTEPAAAFTDEIANEARQRWIWTGDDVNMDPAPPVPLPQPGINKTRSIQISDSERVRITTSAETFRDAVTSLDTLGRALAGVETSRTNYNPLDSDNAYTVAHEVPDGAGLYLNDYPANGLDSDVAYDRQTAAILDAVDLMNAASVGNIDVERVSVGARMARMEQTREMLEVLILDAQKARASIQDADIFEAASKLSSMEVSLQALLSTGARISSLSLMNYI